MGVVRVTLFDFDPTTRTPKEPITAEVEYDPELTLEEQGLKKVSVYCGDDVAGGSVMVPLNTLSAAIAAVLDADTKRSSSIIMPPKGILKPN